MIGQGVIPSLSSIGPGGRWRQRCVLSTQGAASLAQANNAQFAVESLEPGATVKAVAAKYGRRANDLPDGGVGHEMAGGDCLLSTMPVFAVHQGWCRMVAPRRSWRPFLSARSSGMHPLLNGSRSSLAVSSSGRTGLSVPLGRPRACGQWGQAQGLPIHSGAGRDLDATCRLSQRA